jgi:hypothetical protein
VQRLVALLHDGGRRMRISGFNNRGEARITDDDGRLVGYGELRLDDAHGDGLDRGGRFALEVVIRWTPEMPDPDATQFDDMDWEQLLRGA